MAADSRHAWLYGRPPDAHSACFHGLKSTRLGRHLATAKRDYAETLRFDPDLALTPALDMPYPCCCAG